MGGRGTGGGVVYKGFEAGARKTLWLLVLLW